MQPGPYDALTRGKMLATLSPNARFAVKLYFRCQMFKEIALPAEGGVLDQSEFMVAMLEAVHGQVMTIRQEQMEASYKPKPTIIPGVDPSVTENVHIGKDFIKTRRR